MNLSDALNRFPRLFWVVNFLELFERGAYYGMLAVLPYYLVYSLHFASTSFGLILGILTPFLYILPIVSGSLVEKYGFKPMLALSLILIISGYFASSFMNDFEAFVVAFIVLGTGVGSFKPIISASIAHTTGHADRNLGYSIYYWMINLGSFSMPLIISFAIPKEQYVLVFYLSGALIGINLAIALTLFRNPVPPNPEKSVTEVFRGAAMVLKDFRFIALLLIYSGFWFMYSTNHLAILLYALDFGVVGDWFPPALVAVINPGTIILLGPFLGRAYAKHDSLKVMILGMSIFIGGLLVLGMTTITAVFFIGIVIFSIGEFVTHPTYISYVSKIAPNERVTVYMAYAFIPPLIGLTAGNVLGAMMYSSFAEVMHRPKLFWAAIAVIGMVTISLLLLFSRTTVVNKEPMPRDRPRLQRRFCLNLPAIACLLMTPLVLAVAYVGGTDGFLRGLGEESENVWSSYTVINGDSQLIAGDSQENVESVHLIYIAHANMICATFTLNWVDEADEGTGPFALTNQPDEFGISVVAPNGTVVQSRITANTHGLPGSVSVHLELYPRTPVPQGNETFEVTVICGNCGDQTGRFGVRSSIDNGNSWTLETRYQYYSKQKS